jgi:type VI secretion system secreted protein Hcp
MSVDFYLKLDGGLDGESVVEGHKQEIQLLSWSFGGSQTSSVSGTGGSGAGKVDLSDFSIMKTLDKASPKLLGTMAKGTHVKTATLTAVKAGGKGPYLTITFGELFVTSVQWSASSEIPSESVSFSYNHIKVEYKLQGEDGTLKTGAQCEYDVKGNKVT